MKHRLILLTASLLVLILVFIAIEALLIMRNGKPVPVPDIPRDEQTLGMGEPLTYLVMGDSTTVGQGAPYEKSYAVQSARYLSERYLVKFTNVGVSGARAEDVATEQLARVKTLKPDVVLLSVGANDTTHFTSNGSVKKSLQATIDGLRALNPEVKIVVTGSPQMGSIPRFPWPARQLAGVRTDQINDVYQSLIAKNDLFFAPIARETGPAFSADPTLFAQDKFHPNERGYALWTPVINKALDSAIPR